MMDILDLVFVFGLKEKHEEVVALVPQKVEEYWLKEQRVHGGSFC